MNPTSSWIATVTVGNYLLLTVVWTTILVLYLRNYRLAKVEDSLVAVLAAVLAFDALKSVVENVYFGVLWAGRYGIAFEGATEWLSRPLSLLLPKLLTLTVGLVILLVVMRKWIPTELRERRLQKDRQALLRAELLASLEDVREKEERWQLALLASQDGTWDYDLASGRIWASPRFEAQLGYAPGELSSRLNPDEWRAMVHEEDRQNIQAGLDDLRHGRVKADSRELRMRARDGTYRRMVARAVAKAGEDGQATRIVCSQSDVTEQREAEAALAARQRLESLGLLAGGVAHDFNNLLSVVRCNAALVRDEVSSADGAAALADLDLAVARATDLTSRLLAYSGRGRFVVRALDLSALGREMARLLGSSTPPGIRIETDLASGLPLVEADAAQLQQLFMNLFTNAVDALRGTTGTITLRTRLERLESGMAPVAPGEHPLPPGEYVALEVDDTGVGMDEQTRARIFDPFFSNKGPARGMGLSAMLGILRAHDAGMRLRTAPGAGTTFTVWFPFASATATAAASEPKSSCTPHPATAAASALRRVLLADDEPMLRRLFARVLERRGFEVNAVVNGREALDALEKPGAHYSLVILDITMPEMTGPEVLAKLRAGETSLNTVPAILTSGYAESETVLDDRTRFLKKPFTASELTDMLDLVEGR